MRNMLKRITCICFVAILCCSSFAFAIDTNEVHPDSDVNSINLSVENELKIYDESLITTRDPVGPRYQYYWEIVSKNQIGNSYEPYRIGPTGLGPCTLGINEGTSLSRSFTATLSGSYPVGAGTIGSSLGVSFGVAKTYGTSYSITIPSGERRTILYRPKINIYSITQNYIKYDTYFGKKTVEDTAYAQAYVFVNWDYSWRNGY